MGDLGPSEVDVLIIGAGPSGFVTIFPELLIRPMLVHGSVSSDPTLIRPQADAGNLDGSIGDSHEDH